jgi:hypothetical protein
MEIQPTSRCNQITVDIKENVCDVAVGQVIGNMEVESLAVKPNQPILSARATSHLKLSINRRKPSEPTPVATANQPDDSDYDTNYWSLVRVLVAIRPFRAWNLGMV